MRQGTARVIRGVIGATARCVAGFVNGAAKVIEESSIGKYLRVYPQEPQEVTWVRMEDSIEYTVESNTDWKIN